MNLSELLLCLQEGQVAKATFADSVWYVTKSSGFVRYCSIDRTDIVEAVPLTKSNLEAYYEII